MDRPLSASITYNEVTYCCIHGGKSTRGREACNYVSVHSDLFNTVSMIHVWCAESMLQPS